MPFPGAVWRNPHFPWRRGGKTLTSPCLYSPVLASPKNVLTKRFPVPRNHSCPHNWSPTARGAPHGAPPPSTMPLAVLDLAHPDELWWLVGPGAVGTGVGGAVWVGDGLVG